MDIYSLHFETQLLQQQQLQYFTYLSTFKQHTYFATFPNYYNVAMFPLYQHPNSTFISQRSTRPKQILSILDPNTLKPIHFNDMVDVGMQTDNKMISKSALTQTISFTLNTITNSKSKTDPIATVAAARVLKQSKIPKIISTTKAESKKKTGPKIKDAKVSKIPKILNPTKTVKLKGKFEDNLSEISK